MKTLEEIESCGKPMLRVAEIAEFIGCDPQSIRVQARTDASALGFPVIQVGTRTLIPREGFVRFCRAMNLEESARWR